MRNKNISMLNSIKTLIKSINCLSGYFDFPEEIKNDKDKMLELLNSYTVYIIGNSETIQEMQEFIYNQLIIYKSGIKDCNCKYDISDIKFIRYIFKKEGLIFRTIDGYELDKSGKSFINIYEYCYKSS